MTTPGEKFQRMLDLFPHPDRRHLEDPKRRRWKMSELSRESERKLSPAYLSGLINDKHENYGMRYLDMIASIMDFPFELWLAEPEQWPRLLLERGKHVGDEPAGTADRRAAPPVAVLVEDLFESIKDRKTGLPYTNEEVAATSDGRITAQEIAEMRAGQLTNPSRSQLLALCDFFGVDFSYWSVPAPGQPLLDDKAIEALRNVRNRKSYLLLQKSSQLDDNQLDLLLLLVDQLDAASRPPTETED